MERITGRRHSPARASQYLGRSGIGASRPAGGDLSQEPLACHFGICGGCHGSLLGAAIPGPSERCNVSAPRPALAIRFCPFSIPVLQRLGLAERLQLSRLRLFQLELFAPDVLHAGHRAPEDWFILRRDCYFSTGTSFHCWRLVLSRTSVIGGQANALALMKMIYRRLPLYPRPGTQRPISKSLGRPALA